jgi:hypothetical protein
VSPRHDRAIHLPGNTWSFVALAGTTLYTRHNGELWRDRRPVAVFGPELAQVTSTDGHYVFALSVSASGVASVLLLDVARGLAHTVVLPGRRDATAASTYTLLPDPDGRHLWALSPGEGRVVHIDLAAGRIDDTYAFAAGKWNRVPAVATIAPDGETIALADGTHVWFVHLAARDVVRGPSHVAIALGYSPDQRRLWVLGERSRVTSLRVR